MQLTRRNGAFLFSPHKFDVKTEMMNGFHVGLPVSGHSMSRGERAKGRLKNIERG